MEFRNIKTFLCIAEMNSFSKAAEKLGYSQSNVSFQIQQLEQELGVRLFERYGRSIQITQPGREFLFYANEMEKLSLQAVSAVKNPAGMDGRQLSGLLRIGSVESIANGILPDLLADFHSIHPDVQFAVYTGGARNTLVKMVANNQIDFFFDLNDKAPVTGLTGRILRREEIVFVASKKHAGDIAPAGRPNKKIPLSQIAEEDFVLTERNEGYRIELDRLLAACGISVSPVAEFGNPETIIRLIERDMGLSFLPLFCAAEKIKQGDLTVIETDAPKTYMYSQLFYHKNKWITPQMDAMLQFAQEFFRSQPFTVR